MRKIVQELRKNSLFAYILAFSGVVVLIILVLGVYLYQFYYHTIYRDWVTSNENYLSSISSRHENDMKIMEDIIQQVSLSDENTEFLLEESPLKSVALEKQLYSYTSVSQFFFQLYYFYHDAVHLYNQSTSVSLERFLEEGFLLEAVSGDELREFIYHNGKNMKVLKEQRIDGYLSLRFRSVAEQAVVYCKAVGPKNRSTMLFVVGDTYYDNLLDNKEPDLRQDYIVYDDQVIVTRGTLNLDAGAMGELIKTMPEGSQNITLEGRPYLIRIEKGKSGLLYCTVQSRKIFQNKILTGQWGIFFILAICSIPASLAMVALSRRLSRKVRSINRLLSEDEETAYNLETIETGIRTLVESNREINQESLLLRRTRFISNFVRNEYTSRKAAIRAGEKADLHIDAGHFVVVLMGDRGNSNENKAHEMMLGEIIMRENEDGSGIHLIQNNQSLFVIFGDDVTSMKTLLDRFLVIGKEYCEEFVMSASGIHETFETSSEAYLEAAAAYDNRFLVDNERIIYFTEVANREQAELLPVTYLQRLKNAIRSNDETEAKTVIGEICNRMRTSRQSLLTFRIFYNDIIHMMLTECKTNRANFGNIYNVFALSQCLTIQDFNDILSDVCHRLMDAREAVVSDKVDIASEAIKSMKQNFENPDFNMSVLAETLKISGVTLAVEFKSSIGISPSDYLAIIRMERAKVLLKESQLRVKEVSVAVGYEDDHVFMRRFKKYVGKTPGEYRKEEE